MKKALSLLLIVVVLLVVFPLEILNASATWNNNYSLTGNQAYDIITVALAQKNKNRGDLGYTKAWCASFVSSCASRVGASKAVPSGHAVVVNLRNAVLSAGGYEVSSANRQRGDLVLYYCSTCSGYSGYSGYMHIGLVVDSSSTIEGNYNNRVTHNTTGSYTDENGHSTGSGVVKKEYIRPNYSNTPAIPAPTNLSVSVSGTALTLSWKAASGANCYDIIVTKPNGSKQYYHSETTSKVFTDFAFGSYQFDVQSLYRPNGSTTGQIVGAHSGDYTYNFTMASATNLKGVVENNRIKLTWDKAAGANCYDVIMTKPDGSQQWLHTVEPEKYITNLVPGIYKFNVQSLFRPNGNATGQTVGPHSNEISVDNSITAASNVKVCVDGSVIKLNWKAARAANCYDVIVTDSKGNQKWYHSNTTSAKISDLAYGTYQFDVQSLYRVNNSTVGQVVGPHSGNIELIYNMQGASGLIAETTGTNMHVSWNAADGANCYDVIVTKPNGTIDWLHTIEPEKYISIVPGTYKINVQSLYRPNGTSQGQTVGPHCSEITVDNSIQAPSNVVVNQTNNIVRVTWDEARAANCYDVIVTAPNGEKQWYHAVNSWKEFNNLDSGTYHFDVQSLYRVNNGTEGQVVGPHSGEVEYTIADGTQEHSWNSGVITLAPTCTAEGIKTFTCSECAETKTESIPMIDHTIVIDDAIAANCSSTGLTEGSHCSVCGIVIQAQETVPTNELHEYIGSDIIAATCIDEGSRKFICEHCGDTYTESIPIINHTIAFDEEVSPTCVAAGLTEGQHCSVCYAIIVEQEEIPALGHDWSDWQIATAPTSETAGTVVRKCLVCDVAEEKAYPALHEHNYMTEIVEPTCTHTGFTTYTCTDCGYSYIGDIVAMAEHSFKETVTEPTTESQGYTVHTCIVCGYSYVDSITDILPSQMHYNIPSLADIQTTVTIKSDENVYSVTATNGVFELDSIMGDVYRVYAKQKNSLTVCVGEYDTKSGEVTNTNDILLPLGDVNGDDVIDIADISVLLAAGYYGQANADIDLTGDGLITIDDISTALTATNFGKSSVAIV